MRRITATLEDSMILLRWVIGVLFLFLIFTLMFQAKAGKDATDRNFRLGKENNTYVRIVACVSSVNPTKRTPDYVQLCYAKAEQHNDINVEHFGDSK